MLPLKHRLSEKNKITALLRFGFRLSSPSIILIYHNTRNTSPRFGFVVSKKVSTKATKRNFIKRRMREAIARHLPTVKVGAECLFLARPKILNLSYDEMAADLKKLLHQAKLSPPE